MQAAELSGFRWRKAWRRLVKAGRAPVVRVSWFWLGVFMLVAVLVGVVVGMVFFQAVAQLFFSCVRVQ
jgi:hypothetical protein